MDPMLISMISACTALLASIAGPLVTLSVAKRQFSASVLSANRQKWIETLRDHLAELMSQLAALFVVRQSAGDKWKDGMDAVVADPTGPLMARIERIVELNWKIRLLTNPGEPAHVELCDCIQATLDALRHGQLDERQTRERVEHMAKLSQAILRHEWGRVKRGV